MAIIRTVTIVLACALVAACSGQKDPRLDGANEYLSSQSDISSQFQAAIKKGEVLKGMSLQEASAAGGPYIFAMERDRTVWPSEDTDPWQILAAQQLHPDNIKINLLFQNKTQFGTPERVQFTAIFIRGRVVSIELGWQVLTPKRP